MDSISRQLFIDKVSGIVQKNVDKYGFGVVSAIVGQFCKESVFGTSELAVNANNIGGIKRKFLKDGTPRSPIAIGGYVKVSNEVINGNLVPKESEFAAFKSIDDCVEGYFQFLTSSTAYSNLRGIKDSKTYALTIAEDNYSSSGKAYGESIYNDYVVPYNLEKYDKGETNMKTVRIMIDAGHDNYRNQSPVLKTYYESERMYKFSEFLELALERRGFIVGCTRKSLSELKDVVPRGTMGKGYDFLISNHSDACGDPSVDRVSAIVMTNNAISRDLGNLLSTKAAEVMGIKIHKTYSKDAGYDRNGNGKLGDDEYYGVLHGAQSVGCPAIIMEHGFHTNLKVAKWLSEDSNLRILAEAEAEVFAKFFNMNEVTQPNVVQDMETAQTEPTKTIEYTIKKGDTLGKIADSYGATIDEIMTLNKYITDKNKIYPGNKLVIPVNSSKPQPMYHTINKNDGLTSLSKIARAYGISLNQIKLLNPDVKAPLYIVHYDDKIRIK